MGIWQKPPLAVFRFLNFETLKIAIGGFIDLKYFNKNHQWRVLGFIFKKKKPPLMGNSCGVRAKNVIGNF